MSFRRPFQPGEKIRPDLDWQSLQMPVALVKASVTVIPPRRGRRLPFLAKPVNRHNPVARRVASAVVNEIRFAHESANLVGRVPSRGEQDVFEWAVNRKDV